jgi:drug/metabolite transporter (DMT)-like permease
VLGVVLALASSIIWGIADFIGGVQARRQQLIVVLLGAQATATVVAVGLVVALDDPLPRGAAVGWAVGGGLLGCAALAAFYRGLAIGSMSIVAPVSATGVIVPVVFGVVAEGERPSGMQVAGIAIALFGIVLAAREPHDAEKHHLDRQTARTALLLALVAAVGFGVFLLGLERATASAGVGWSLLMVRAAQVTLLLLATAVLRPRLAIGARAFVPIAAVGVLDITANAMFAFATTLGLLSIVAILGSLYPAMTVILARTVLKEKVSRVQEAGVAIVLAGVVAITVG